MPQQAEQERKRVGEGGEAGSESMETRIRRQKRAGGRDGEGWGRGTDTDTDTAGVISHDDGPGVVREEWGENMAGDERLCVDCRSCIAPEAVIVSFRVEPNIHACMSWSISCHDMSACRLQSFWGCIALGLVLVSFVTGCFLLLAFTSVLWLPVESTHLLASLLTRTWIGGDQELLCILVGYVFVQIHGFSAFLGRQLPLFPVSSRRYSEIGSFSSVMILIKAEETLFDQKMFQARERDLYADVMRDPGFLRAIFDTMPGVDSGKPIGTWRVEVEICDHLQSLHWQGWKLCRNGDTAVKT
eukprot:762098-Hanusia_phi.AAC.2